MNNLWVIGCESFDARTTSATVELDKYTKINQLRQHFHKYFEMLGIFPELIGFTLAQEIDVNYLLKVRKKCASRRAQLQYLANSDLIWSLWHGKSMWWDSLEIESIGPDQLYQCNLERTAFASEGHEIQLPPHCHRSGLFGIRHHTASFWIVPEGEPLKSPDQISRPRPLLIDDTHYQYPEMNSRFTWKSSSFKKGKIAILVSSYSSERNRSRRGNSSLKAPRDFAQRSDEEFA